MYGDLIALKPRWEFEDSAALKALTYIDKDQYNISILIDGKVAIIGGIRSIWARPRAGLVCGWRGYSARRLEGYFTDRPPSAC